VERERKRHSDIDKLRTVNTEGEIERGVNTEKWRDRDRCRRIRIERGIERQRSMERNG